MFVYCLLTYKHQRIEYQSCLSGSYISRFLYIYIFGSVFGYLD